MYESPDAIAGIILQNRKEEKSLKIQSIQHLYLLDTRVHFMTINFAFSSGVLSQRLRSSVARLINQKHLFTTKGI